MFTLPRDSRVLLLIRLHQCTISSASGLTVFCRRRWRIMSVKSEASSGPAVGATSPELSKPQGMRCCSPAGVESSRRDFPTATPCDPVSGCCQTVSSQPGAWEHSYAKLSEHGRRGIPGCRRFPLFGRLGPAVPVPPPRFRCISPAYDTYTMMLQVS